MCSTKSRYTETVTLHLPGLASRDAGIYGGTVVKIENVDKAASAAREFVAVLAEAAQS